MTDISTLESELWNNGMDREIEEGDIQLLNSYKKSIKDNPEGACMKTIIRILNSEFTLEDKLILDFIGAEMYTSVDARYKTGSQKIVTSYYIRELLQFTPKIETEHFKRKLSISEHSISLRRSLGWSAIVLHKIEMAGYRSVIYSEYNRFRCEIIPCRSQEIYAFGDSRVSRAKAVYNAIVVFIRNQITE